MTVSVKIDGRLIYPDTPPRDLNDHTLREVFLTVADWYGDACWSTSNHNWRDRLADECDRRDLRAPPSDLASPGERGLLITYGLPDRVQWA